MAAFDQYGNPTTPNFTQTPSQTGNRGPAQQTNNQQNNGFVSGDQFGNNNNNSGGNAFQTNYNSGGATPSQPAAPGFTPINADFSAYSPGQLPSKQFANYNPNLVNLSPTNDMQQQAIQKVLGEGGSLNPTVQAQMQGQLKDQALTMQAGNDAATRQNFANRGYSGGGQENALLAQSRLGTQSNLLNNYRDLGVQAAQTNRGDILNALGAASGVQGSQTQTNAAQEGLRQAGVQSQNAGTQFDFQSALQKAQLGTQQEQIKAQLALQQQLGLGGLGLGYSQLNNNVQQNALNTALGLTQ